MAAMTTAATAVSAHGQAAACVLMATWVNTARHVTSQTTATGHSDDENDFMSN